MVQSKRKYKTEDDFFFFLPTGRYTYSLFCLVNLTESPAVGVQCVYRHTGDHDREVHHLLKVRNIFDVKNLKNHVAACHLLISKVETLRLCSPIRGIAQRCSFEPEVRQKSNLRKLLQTYSACINEHNATFFFNFNPTNKT